MKSKIIFASIIILALFFISQSNNNYFPAYGPISICLDTNCITGITWTARLYDSNNVNIKTCVINPAESNCCIVDSVPYPAQYRWRIFSDSLNCTGSYFNYTGGDVVITFSCINCRQ